jgi:fatty acid desaturase
MTLQWSRSPGKKGSHFHPDSDLFAPNERKDVITSTACWTAMAALVACLSFVMGPVQMLKLYGIPYWVGLVLGLPISLPFFIISTTQLFFSAYIHTTEFAYKCRFLSCGWTWSLTCITMDMMRNFLGIVERLEDESP